MISKVSSNANGRLEIAASRKDQLNSTTPGGKVCTISFIPLNPNGADTVEVQGASAIREPYWASALNIFPNPYTNGALSIRGELPSFDVVKILDQSGRILQSQTGNIRLLNLEELPAGTYLLQIEADGEIVNRQVVKQ